jgi:hypothetical protein
MEAACPAANRGRHKNNKKKRSKTEADRRFIMGLLSGRIPQP